MSAGEMSNADKMAAMRTTLAFQRTRMAADRTLMSVQRTALSLIGFGFTIFSFFRSLIDKNLVGDAVPQGAPGRFGLALVTLGVLLLSGGIATHFRYMRELREQRTEMIAMGMLAGEDRFPVSLALVGAFLLLLVGLLAALRIIARTGPF